MMVVYHCQHCKVPFSARESDRKRGWALFCSKSCAQKAPPVWFLKRFETLTAEVLRLTAENEALTGFIEELRDHKPTIHSGRHKSGDPAWDEDDVMPVDEFTVFQDDAEKLIGKKRKVAP
jgi:hypothetical protein